MTDNTSARPAVAKLEKYCELASDNRGQPNFFKYLFKYFQILSSDQKLTHAALKFWCAGFLDRYKDDNEGLLEALTPVFNIEQNLTFQQKVQQLADIQFKSNPLQASKLMLLVNNWLEKQSNKEINPSYCFYQLYFKYHASRSLGLNSTTVRKGFDLLISNPKKMSEALRQYFDEEVAAELQAVLEDTDTNTVEKLSKQIEDDLQIVPSDEWLRVYSQSDCEASLNFFHTEFIDWLSDNWDNLDKTEPPESLTQVELILDKDMHPQVRLPSGEILPYSYMKTKVQTIIGHCYKKPGIGIGTSSFSGVNFGGKGIVNALRGSKFYPPDGALSVFLTVSTKTPRTITLHRKRQLNDSQLQQLINQSEE